MQEKAFNALALYFLANHPNAKAISVAIGTPQP
jgi:hypothetical protein